MSNEIVYVVGDKFEGFGKNHRVITIGELERRVATGNKELMFGDDTRLVAGQGIQPERLSALRKALALRGYPYDLDMLRLGDAAEGVMSHKRLPHNIMITAPTKVSDEKFSASIQLNDLCAELADHMTGQHIQGMVLLEAARQMFIAVVGTFLLDPAHSHDPNFVINRLNVDYLSFAFPLPIDIDFTLKSRDTNSAGSLSIDARIEIYQLDAKISDILARFTLYKSAVMRMVEGMKAKETLDLSDQLLLAAGVGKVAAA